ncbi:TraR/DksA family transcriptional regulator [Actinopolymorpha pittospori]|uniref:DnaK suppressor protein n=1 Tax=Actinopolymorpha pittospori TaxID=648752 RepID=A0A927RN61_9ACTN|nr:DnaK suppressor protein [Actinopolymorpha pittospori]
MTSERRATTRKSTATRKTAPARKRASVKAAGAKTSDASPGTRGRAQEQKGSPDRGGQVKGDSSVKRDGVEKTQPARKRTSTRRSTAEGTSGRQAPTKRATTKRASSRQTAAEQAAGAESTGQATPTQAEERPNAATDLAESARLLVVRPEEEPWTPEELAEVYHELADDVSRLKAELHSATDELADLLRDSGDGAGDDQADAGSKTFEREHEMSLANNTREMLEQTERAVARIRNGTYGVCEGCANPIGKARLLAFPRATLCVSCKQKEERR